MDKRKLMVASALVLGVGAMSLIPIGIVSAQEAGVSGSESTFLSTLAQKLGLSQDVVKTALDSTKEELKSTRIAEREASINQAVTDGTLTQRQADILNKMDEAHEAKRAEMEELTEEEREAKREEMKSLTSEERRSAMQAELVDELNELGLNTSAEEVEAALTAAKDAGIMPMGKGPRGGRGNFGGQGF